MSSEHKSREVIWGGQLMGADFRARSAREAAEKAAREPDRAEAEALVRPHGRLRRARPAVSDHRPMSSGRSGLARDGVQLLQDRSEPAAGRHPPAAGYADLEAGSLAEMPLLPEGPHGAAGAHDQADCRARNHALQVEAPDEER